MKSAPLEIQFDAPEAFALTVQHTVDGERVAQAAAQAAADQAASDQRQTEFASLKSAI